MPVALAILFLAAAAAFFADRAQAGDDATCHAYATEAVNIATEMQNLGCGKSSASPQGLDFSHPQWSTSYSIHADWCLTANNESIDHERVERGKKADQCRACGRYATEAREDAITNRVDRCGYDPNDPTWSENRADHMNWCMAASPDSILAQSLARGGPTTIRCRICREYARVAVSAVTEAKELKCGGIGGPRWSGNEDEHFNWCRALNVYDRDQAIPKETSARATRLYHCKASAKAQQGLSKGAGSAAGYTAVPRKKAKADTKPIQAARKPSGKTVQPAPNANAPGSGSSAMDRLGGGNPSGTGSAAAAGAARSRGGSDTAAPAASQPGGGGAAGAPATSINRNAIGGGGAERIR